MEKILFAVFLLVALFGAPAAAREEHAEWAIALRTGNQFRAQLRIEPSGRIELTILLRQSALDLHGFGHGCITNWRRRHA